MKNPTKARRSSCRPCVVEAVERRCLMVAHPHFSAPFFPAGGFDPLIRTEVPMQAMSVDAYQGIEKNFPGRRWYVAAEKTGSAWGTVASNDAARPLDVRQFNFSDPNIRDRDMIIFMPPQSAKSYDGLVMNRTINKKIAVVPYKGSDGQIAEIHLRPTYGALTTLTGTTVEVPVELADPFVGDPRVAQYSYGMMVSDPRTASKDLRAVIAGLDFSYYGVGLRIHSTDNVTVQGCSFSLNEYAGVSVDLSQTSADLAIPDYSENFRFTDNSVVLNGTYGGVFNGAPQSLFQGNYWAFNNWLDYYKPSATTQNGTGEGHHAQGTMKVSYSKGVKFYGNLVERNYGSGIWFDHWACDGEIIGNVIRDNHRNIDVAAQDYQTDRGFGIILEFAKNVNIAFNVISNNGNAGINISGCADINVFNNTLVDNGVFYKVVNGVIPEANKDGSGGLNLWVKDLGYNDPTTMRDDRVTIIPQPGDNFITPSFHINELWAAAKDGVYGITAGIMVRGNIFHQKPNGSALQVNAADVNNDTPVNGQLRMPQDFPVDYFGGRSTLKINQTESTDFFRLIKLKSDPTPNDRYIPTPDYGATGTISPMDNNVYYGGRSQNGTGAIKWAHVYQPAGAKPSNDPYLTLAQVQAFSTSGYVARTGLTPYDKRLEQNGYQFTTGNDPLRDTAGGDYRPATDMNAWPVKPLAVQSPPLRAAAAEAGVSGVTAGSTAIEYFGALDPTLSRSYVTTGTLYVAARVRGNTGEGIEVNASKGVVGSTVGGVHSTTVFLVRYKQTTAAGAATARLESWILDDRSTGTGTPAINILGSDGSDRLTALVLSDAFSRGSRIPVPSSIYGASGNDTLTGSAGNDTLAGNQGNDYLFGRRGNDLLEGEQGNDSLSGSTGDDRLVGGTGNDTLSGGDGIDTFFCADGAIDTLDGGVGVDILGSADATDVLRSVP